MKGGDKCVVCLYLQMLSFRKTCTCKPSWWQHRVMHDFQFFFLTNFRTKGLKRLCPLWDALYENSTFCLTNSDWQACHCAKGSYRQPWHCSWYWFPFNTCMYKVCVCVMVNAILGSASDSVRLLFLLTMAWLRKKCTETLFCSPLQYMSLRMGKSGKDTQLLRPLCHYFYFPVLFLGIWKFENVVTIKGRRALVRRAHHGDPVWCNCTCKWC